MKKMLALLVALVFLSVSASPVLAGGYAKGPSGPSKSFDAWCFDDGFKKGPSPKKGASVFHKVQHSVQHSVVKKPSQPAQVKHSVSHKVQHKVVKK